MGKSSARYVAKAVPGAGWRVWDRKRSRWWGNHHAAYPAALLRELNADKSSELVVELNRKSFVPRNEPKPKARRRRS